MALNVKLLKKVRDAIARTRANTRQQFDMSYWGFRRNGNETMLDYVGELFDTSKDAKRGECRTACCIAGHVVLQSTPQQRKKAEVTKNTDIEIAAQRLLGLEWRDGARLFYGGWSEYGDADRRITRREAVDYLDECIAAKRIV